ncbi:MAG: hypothetical protein IPN72_11480 [Saprospiraceae bacterium]|nr:hypothetical protein [Saprospiraceae bacterium]
MRNKSRLKIKRLAFEIAEHNHQRTAIILGINNNGYGFAKLSIELKKMVGNPP